MEQIIYAKVDPDYGMYPASDIVLTYDGGSDTWSVYSLGQDEAVPFDTLYLASDLAGAVIGVNSLAASTGPTGALQLIEEPAP